MTAPPPLLRPTRWHGASPVGAGTVIFGLVLVAVGIGATALFASVEAPPVAVVSCLWLVAAGVIVTGLWVLDREPRAHAQLVNGVAVTPTEQRLPDDWVHLVRGTAMNPILRLGLYAYGVYALLMAVTAITESRGQFDAPMIASAVFGALATAMLGAAFRASLGRRRLAGFGTAPIGLTLGRSGVTHITLDAVRFVAWPDILRVEASTAARGRDTAHLYRTITLVMHDGAASGEPLVLPTLRFRLDATALYTALATFTHRPELRAELGTTRGQAMLDTWADAAATPDADAL